MIRTAKRPTTERGEQILTNPLDRAKIEKAAVDHGFDLTPTLKEEWMVLRSTRLPVGCGVRVVGADRYEIAVSDPRIAVDLARGLTTPTVEPKSRSIFPADSYRSLFGLLGRIAELGRCLPTKVADRFHEATGSMPRGTEAERLVVTRIGQQLFRDALIDYWQGTCAVTGLSIVPLLRASHIKPWAQCASDEERLDVFNGLLLAPNLDALFDGGWITFDAAGMLVVSPRLDNGSRVTLGLCDGMRLRWLGNEHRSFLKFHRSSVFCGNG